MIKIISIKGIHIDDVSDRLENWVNDYIRTLNQPTYTFSTSVAYNPEGGVYCLVGTLVIKDSI